MRESARRRRLLGMLLVIAVAFGPGFVQLGRLRWRSYRLGCQIEARRIQNVRLAEQIERLESDPVYIEQVARQRFGVAREGEVIVEVVESD